MAPAEPCCAPAPTAGDQPRAPAEAPLLSPAGSLPEPAHSVTRSVESVALDWAAGLTAAKSAAQADGQSPEDAEDSTSEAVAKFLSQPEQVRNFSVWLPQVARLCGRTTRRKEQRRARLRGRRMLLEGIESPSTGDPPCEILEVLEKLQAAMTLLSALPRRILRLWSRGRSLVVIARRLGLSASTVRYHRDRGLAQLRNLLGDAC